MTMKTYKVYFASTSTGRDGAPMHARLLEAFNAHGANLPIQRMESDFHQVRDLRRIGNVWQGVFARLKDDAPHIVDAAGAERQIAMRQGDRILEKCHFIYRTRSNLVIWQASRSAGGLGRAAEYLSRVFDVAVSLPYRMNEAELQRVLDGAIYEISFGYHRPDRLEDGAARWQQGFFNTINHVHAAHAKFTMRAQRGGQLADAAKDVVGALVRTVIGAEKVRVRLTEETDPIDLFLAPLKESIRVELHDSYPDAADVYRELEEAYDRQRNNLTIDPTRP